MKADDRTMTWLTGIVLTIGVGSLAQNSDSIMAAFSGKTSTAAADDSFTIRAGKTQILNVIANDPAADKAREIRIVSQPSCGTVSKTGLSLEYTGSGSCTGPTIFEYCVEGEGGCDSAMVTLNVIGARVRQPEPPVVVATKPVPAVPAPQPARTAEVEATELAPAPAPVANDDLRLAVLSALDRPLGPDDGDDEEEEFQRSPPEAAPPSVENLTPTPPGNTAEPQPEATTIPLATRPEGILVDDAGTRVASLPAADGQGTPTSLDGPDDFALTTILRGSVPDFGAVSAAQIMLPTTQDRLGSRVGAASHTEALAALRTDTLFIARIDAGQVPVSAPMANTAELTSAAAPQLPVTPTTPAPNTQTAALCTVSFDLDVSAGATVQANIDASCRPNEVIILEHAGIRFSAKTDPGGRALVTIPAVTSNAEVRLQFADGSERVAQISVPDMDRYLRIAVTWSGAAELQLHALEFGADTGDRGHVWSGTPRSYRDARRFGGGYLTALGLKTGGGPQAEVYTLPLFRRADAGLVEMSLALVGDAACDADFSVRAVRSDITRSASIRELRFNVTDCDRRSEPVFIANALEDLRVASRR